MARRGPYITAELVHYNSDFASPKTANLDDDPREKGELVGFAVKLAILSLFQRGITEQSSPPDMPTGNI